jgi:ABC-type sugar transport system permease subunit/ABC-type glycerol-3-phosphate transport system substrate-binding protein
MRGVFTYRLPEHRRSIVGTMIVCASLALVVAGARGDERIRLRLDHYYPDRPQPSWQAIVIVASEFMRDHPNVDVIPAEPLQVGEGALGEDSGRLMAIAGRIAPDVMRLWFHQLHLYAEREYILPLDEYIGTDTNGDGFLDDDEATWPGWREIPMNIRLAAMVNGHVYGLPYGDFAQLIIYRQDLFREVGLDPTQPPKTWEEFLFAARKLTRKAGVDKAGRPVRERYGVLLSNAGYRWLPWLWSAGGDAVQQGRRDPDTGRMVWFPKETIHCVTPDGQDLTREPAVWRASFASDAGVRAIEFMWRLRWGKFIHHPQTGDPIVVTQADIDRGFVTTEQGERIPFTKADVLHTAVRREELLDVAAERNIDLFARGDVAILIDFIGSHLGEMPLAPEHIGFCPFPAGPGGKRVVSRQPMWFALSSQLAGPSQQHRRDLAWELLERVCSRRTQVLFARLSAEGGQARLLPPKLMEEAGLHAYLETSPPHFREAFDLLALGRTEPFVGHWQAVQDDLLGNGVLEGLMIREDFDAVKALKQAQAEANRRLFGGRPPDVQAKYRRIARWGLAGAGLLLLVMGVLIGRTIRQHAREASRKATRVEAGGWRRAGTAALLLAPAVLSILVWSYYPLARGSLMAFQEYRLVGKSEWVGLDQFIDVLAPDGKFYLYFWNTIRFAAWTLGLTFLTPIGLAILLSEIPLGRYFYRTVYFLPQVASGLVILFLWKVFYEPTQDGWLNRLVSLACGLVGQTRETPIDWLHDARFAMVAVVLPTMWAGMGIGSLIYLAALKNVPDDLYEAAEIDGCGMRRKFWHITLPTLKPLILINFVGAFVGTFQGMSNILVMTGGGPQESTMVLGLAIWSQAFVYLSFGLATAMAWVLGLMLIGFTLWQLRILKRVEFRRAENM